MNKYTYQRHTGEMKGYQSQPQQRTVTTDLSEAAQDALMRVVNGERLKLDKRTNTYTLVESGKPCPTSIALGLLNDGDLICLEGDPQLNIYKHKQVVEQAVAEMVSRSKPQQSGVDEYGFDPSTGRYTDAAVAHALTKAVR